MIHAACSIPAACQPFCWWFPAYVRCLSCAAAATWVKPCVVSLRAPAWSARRVKQVTWCPSVAAWFWVPVLIFGFRHSLCLPFGHFWPSNFAPVDVEDNTYKACNWLIRLCWGKKRCELRVLPGTGDVVEAVRHIRTLHKEIRMVQMMDDDELFTFDAWQMVGTNSLHYRLWGRHFASIEKSCYIYLCILYI